MNWGEKYSVFWSKVESARIALAKKVFLWQVKTAMKDVSVDVFANDIEKRIVALHEKEIRDKVEAEAVAKAAAQPAARGGILGLFV